MIGSFAGGFIALPVSRSKRAPCDGHAIQPLRIRPHASGSAIADQDRTSAVVKGKSLSAFNSINAHGTHKIRFAHPTHSFDYSQSEIALPHRHKGGIQ
jgi:hypothetical protein